MAKTGKTGVTASTPKNILFGAGTIHKNLTYSGSKWNFDESLIGATSGGSKFTITEERVNIEADGALVASKGLVVKVGETAEMEVNFLELTKEVIQMALSTKAGTSPDTTKDVLESKANIADTDYLTNIAFVGKLLDGREIIVIMDNALCTSGLEVDAQNKESGVVTLTFACHAELTSDLDTLPYHIYYPKAVA